MKRFRLSLLCGVIITAAVFGQAKSKTVRPGIKTPGIQISMANLKPEAAIPVAGIYGAVAMSRTPMILQRDAGTILRIDPRENKPGKPIEGLKGACGEPLTAFTSIWVPLCGENALARIDPASGKISARVAVPLQLKAVPLTATADSLWLISDARSTLLRIDPQSNEIVADIRLPAACSALHFAESAVWVVCPAENKLLRVEPKTNLIDQRIEVAHQPVAIASGAGSIWVLGSKEGKISRVDPKTFKVSETIDLSVPGFEGAMDFGEGALWVSGPGFPIARITPGAANETAKVAQQFFGEGSGPVRVAAASLWISNIKAGTLLRFDPKRIVATIPD